MLGTWKINKMRLVRMAEKWSKTILHRGFTESIENILKTIKLTENTVIQKATAIHWREASDGQEHWLMHWGWLKSDQTCTQANMLVVFPLTTPRDRRCWSTVTPLGHLKCQQVYLRDSSVQVTWHAIAQSCEERKYFTLNTFKRNVSNRVSNWLFSKNHWWRSPMSVLCPI